MRWISLLRQRGFGLRTGVLALCAWGIAVHAAHADPAAPVCVTPSSSVVTAVVIRQAPNGTSVSLGRLAPKQQLPVSGEVPNWIQVTLKKAGGTGFVSKRWVVEVDCADSTPVAGPATGSTFELDAIDVGTGLSILVKGWDFTLLYDAGSNDDLSRGAHNRVLAYLKSAAPDVSRIDHLVLSHPHRDHVELMADVVETFKPGQVWDSGASTDICGYRAFLRAIADTGVLYHTATFGAGDESHFLKGLQCYGIKEPDATLTLHHGARIDTAPMTLGAHATLTFLHVDGVTHSNLNDNSLVARLDLGNHTVLLMGDAEAGFFYDTSTTEIYTSVEGKLLDCCADQLHADVLVVGHHGSKSSSRKKTLDAIGAKVFIVSAGPTKYGTVVLPDQAVIEELLSRGTVWRTDTNDAACRTSTTKIGPPNDGAPGGCSNVRVILTDTGLNASMSP